MNFNRLAQSKECRLTRCTFIENLCTVQWGQDEPSTHFVRIAEQLYALLLQFSPSNDAKEFQLRHVFTAATEQTHSAEVDVPTGL